MWLPGHYLLAPQPSPSFVARLGGAKNPPGNIYWSTHILAGTPHWVLTLPVWQTLTLSAQ